MASVLLKRCTGCREYTLQETCPRCGAKAKPNRPAKFSPEDNFGEYRRKLKKLDAAKGVGNSDSERVAGKQAATPAPAAKSAESAKAVPKAPPTKPPMSPMSPMDDPAAASARSAKSAVPAGRAKDDKPGRRQGF